MKTPSGVIIESGVWGIEKSGISGWLRLSINNQPFKKGMSPWTIIAF